MSKEERDNLDQLDSATAARLARLNARPVDLTRLDAMMKRQIPRRPASVLRRITRLNVAIAASVLIAACVFAAFLTLSNGEVLASPAQMAQVHNDILANRIPVTRVSSIEEAGQTLSQSWNDSPALPQPPQGHVMACCMKSIKDKHVACVLLQDSTGTPITMSVARSADMKLPKGPTVTKDSVTYHIQSSGSLNMVSVEQSGRWVCLIAELPQDRLIDLATKLRF